jgi:hypothetical protein
MPCQKTTAKYQGVVRPHALFTIHQLQQLEYVLLGDILTDTAARHVPGIEHIPVLYAPYVLGNWRARYRELATGEAERLTKEIGKYVPPAYIELGPDADAISIYHEAVHARRAMLGRTMTPAAAEPSAKRAETFARTLETKAHRIPS